MRVATLREEGHAAANVRVRRVWKPEYACHAYVVEYRDADSE